MRFCIRLSGPIFGGSNWTYICTKWFKILKLLLFLILLLQMCVQWKIPEVSIMFLRGDISILVPAVFRKLWLFLPRQLYRDKIGSLDTKNSTVLKTGKKAVTSLGWNRSQHIFQPSRHCSFHMLWKAKLLNSGINSQHTSKCFAPSPRRPYGEYKRMVLEHTHGLFIT